jgi:two-component system response regulator HydG
LRTERASRFIEIAMESSSFAVLVVDDDEMVLSTLTWLFESRAIPFECVRDVKSAKQALDRRHFDAILVDMYLPDGEGLAILDRALELDPAPSVLMITARAEIRSAVEAMRRGAADFLEKPLDLDDLAMRLERATENAALRRKLAVYEAKNEQAPHVVASSSALREVFAIADRVAATPSSSALILGESGVGKEVIAARIHSKSDRSKGPLVRVNVAAIPETMIEAELFGSVRGAFTDAKRDRAGHFASAEGGTLLLDEVFELKPELQPKLLRALEERRYFPVGSDRERRMNVRVLAATNRNPKEMIDRGLLRSDLYYRLSTVAIQVPPLRERPDDIVPLAAHFAAIYRAEFRRPKIALTAAAQDALVAYTWPGNVRELRNVIERATMLAETDAIGPDDLGIPYDPGIARTVSDGKVPAAAATTGDTAGQATRLDEVEKEHIVRMLAKAGGSRTRAATMLGISRSTLWEKGKRFGIF